MGANLIASGLVPMITDILGKLFNFNKNFLNYLLVDLQVTYHPKWFSKGFLKKYVKNLYNIFLIIIGNDIKSFIVFIVLLPIRSCGCSCQHEILSILNFLLSSLIKDFLYKA